MEDSFACSHKVIVGLGNPGMRYSRTRHNVGAMAVSTLAKRMNSAFKEEKRFHAFVAKAQYQSMTVHFLLPTTYMNESGKAINAYLNFFRLSCRDLIVVNDDVELPFGTLRLRLKGSSGGHNGLKSIEACLSSQDFARLKIGVGKELKDASLADYVLDVFNPEESVKLPDLLEKAADTLQDAIL